MDDTYDQLLEIPYYFGRRDCDHSPSGKNYKEGMPTGSEGWQYIYDFMRDNTGMNTEQIIAIIGAHTLGQAHSYFSGFGTKPWVSDPYALNNHFFSSLVYQPWHQLSVNCENSSNGCKYEWHDEEDEHLMLNSDICIFWDIHPDENGEVDCDLESCPDQDEYIKNIVLSFADDNQYWLEVFADAWDILIKTGYDTKRLREYYV